jgi:hypothetical protein
LQSEPSEQKYKQVGLFEKKVDLLDHYGKRLEDLEQNARLEQSEVSLAKVCGAIFTFILSVVFKFHLHSLIIKFISYSTIQITIKHT